MLYILISVAIILFIAHVFLLFTSFSNASVISSRYFYSHLTLWLTGLSVFALAALYSGTNQSGFLDYFDTWMRKSYILLFTFGLSLVAHAIVTFLVLPLLRKSKTQ
ncbi:hypothetical protein SNE26_07100 [Mucilaginibacter sp. cycad4]|uniref:hypothetical protein n=1 Tax=Mucilaginibacter sp. cycad4 TaxID=3342096 RepID=UPI002AAB797E|nr:hypothetical protein [Mucilaginibacter gossypii]WPV01538.1 hypothetical protein SNE26_07100 [Mucilaginibacter gossypii]